MNIGKKRWKYFAFFVVVIGLLAISILTMYNVNQRHYSILTDPSELLDIAKKDLMSDIIIDLRDKNDYEVAHIGKTINIPFVDGSEIDDYLIKNNSKSKTVYLFCYSGNRAAVAFNYLTEKGYKSLVYVNFGYEEFCERTNNTFIPATGPCDCLADEIKILL